MSDESCLEPGRYCSSLSFGDTECGEHTEQDLEMLSRTMSQIQDGMNAAIEAMNNMIFGFTWAFDIKPIGPTYRTEPIEGVELGGQPRNPETDVIDEIDRFVNWQLEKGGGW